MHTGRTLWLCWPGPRHPAHADLSMKNVQSRLAKITRIPDEEIKKTELIKLARELGCSTNSLDDPSRGLIKFLEEVLIQRIQEAARSWRESNLWLIALVSAISAVLSALAAWCAVLKAGPS